MANIDAIQNETRSLVRQICRRMREISPDAGSTVTTSTRSSSMRKLKLAEVTRVAELKAQLKYASTESSIREQKLQVEEAKFRMEKEKIAH